MVSVKILYSHSAYLKLLLIFMLRKLIRIKFLTLISYLEHYYWSICQNLYIYWVTTSFKIIIFQT